MIVTIKLRLKDKHAAELNRQARAVNYVWNYCNEMQQKAARSGRLWLTAVDLQRLTAGSSKALGLHGHTIQKTCQRYDQNHRQHRKAWLRFRGRKSLGWVPFSTKTVTVVRPGAIRFRGITYRTMHWRDLPAGTVIRAGSFNADARGRWYINMPIEKPLEALPRSGSTMVGIDLGLAALATLSTGEKIAAPQHYRRLAKKLGDAQRANKKRLARTTTIKITNTRKDHLHKASARIALAHGLIVVGNVSSSKLSRTNMAKSVLDASWCTFKRQLGYKALRHGSIFAEVDEARTSQTCSSCGALPPERPKGIAGLGIREWSCSCCGAVHDRDVNAAKNILRLGQQSLAEGAWLGVPAKSCQHIGSHPGPYVGSVP